MGGPVSKWSWGERKPAHHRLKLRCRMKGIENCIKEEKTGIDRFNGWSLNERIVEGDGHRN